MAKSWKKYLGLAVFGLGTLFGHLITKVDKEEDFKNMTPSVQNVIIQEQDSIKNLLSGISFNLKTRNYNDAAVKFKQINTKLPTIERFRPAAYKIFNNDLEILETTARKMWKVQDEFSKYFNKISSMSDYYHDLAKQYKKKPEEMSRKVEFGASLDLINTEFQTYILPELEDLNNYVNNLSNDYNIKDDAVKALNYLIDDMLRMTREIADNFRKTVKMLPAHEHADSYNEVIEFLEGVEKKLLAHKL